MGEKGSLLSLFEEKKIGKELGKESGQKWWLLRRIVGGGYCVKVRR